MSLADKCIVVGCFVCGYYDEILIETRKGLLHLIEGQSTSLFPLRRVKVAYTSGPFFEKIIKRYPIFSLQINYYRID